jgi:predicted O-methyltransferase YrrM
MAFPDVFARARDIPGWLTEDQARRLHEEVASRGPGARVVEIGSHHGRSTIVLAAAGAHVVAVDPFPEDWRYGGPGTEQVFRDNLTRAGVADRVEVRVTTSRQARAGWTSPVDVVYVDGKHDYWTVRDDLRWSEHLAPDGVLLVHDAFSSLGVTTALLRELLGTTRLRYVGRTGSLASLVVGEPSARDRLRVMSALPWWVRNLVVKVLLRLRLAPLVRMAGHQGAADPY